MTALINSDVLVHIGLHKTATSWLQENLFTRMELGFYGPAESRKRRALVKNVGHFLVADESGHLINEWEFDARAVRASLASFEAREGLWPVVSYERLSGHPLSNGFDRQMICHRIKAVFPKARILICIREQRAIILSNYVQYLRNGGWNTPEAFLKSSSRWPPADNYVEVLGISHTGFNVLQRLRKRFRARPALRALRP